MRHIAVITAPVLVGACLAVAWMALRPANAPPPERAAPQTPPPADLEEGRQAPPRPGDAGEPEGVTVDGVVHPRRTPEPSEAERLAGMPPQQAVARLAELLEQIHAGMPKNSFAGLSFAEARQQKPNLTRDEYLEERSYRKAPSAALIRAMVNLLENNDVALRRALHLFMSDIQDVDGSVSFALGVALGQVNDERALRALLAAVRRPTTPDWVGTKRVLVLALAQRRGPYPHDSLDGDIALSWIAGVPVDSQSPIEDGRVLRTLESILADAGEYRSVRMAALRALTAASADVPRVRAAVMHTLSDHDAVLRMASLRSMRRMDGPVVDARLMQVAREDSNPGARHVALWNLVQREAPGHEEFVMERYRDSATAEDRRACIKVLKQVEGQSAHTRSFLRQLATGSEDVLMQAEAIRALNPSPESLEFALQVAESADDERVPGARVKVNAARHVTRALRASEKVNQPVRDRCEALVDELNELTNSPVNQWLRAEGVLNALRTALDEVQ